MSWAPNVCASGSSDTPDAIVWGSKNVSSNNKILVVGDGTGCTGGRCARWPSHGGVGSWNADVTRGLRYRVVRLYDTMCVKSVLNE